MGRYRKKPVEIEAFKWIGDSNSIQYPIWFRLAIERGSIWFAEDGLNGKQEMIIRTLEGNHRAKVGDYIIKGVKGEIYPCKPDIFEMTYEDSCKERILTVVTDIRELKIPIEGNGDVVYYISSTEEGMLSIADKIFINEKSFKYCYIEESTLDSIAYWAEYGLNGDIYIDYRKS